jgi:peptide/nickel transport system permease protein
MLNYTLRRVLGMVPLLFGISLITFVVVQMAPGKPTDIFQQAMHSRVDPHVYEKLREIYGLDRPLWVQFKDWVLRVVRLDFGLSMSTDRRPVLTKILEALPYTVLLNVLSLLLTLLIAFPLAIYCALYPGSLLDRFATFFTFLGFATPTFWFALLLMLFLGITFPLFPISFVTLPSPKDVGFFVYLKEFLYHLALPVFTLTFGEIAVFTRYLKGSLLEILKEEYFLTARAKGIPLTKAVLTHALPNALLPFVTLMGLMVPHLIGGSVLLETIFAIPGMGRLFVQGVYIRDYTLIMGILTLGAVLTLIGNLLADLGYAFLDPRIRKEFSR